MTVDLKKGKTDQEGKGRLVGIPRGEDEDTCPIQYLYGRPWELPMTDTVILLLAVFLTGIVSVILVRHGGRFSGLSTFTVSIIAAIVSTTSAYLALLVYLRFFSTLLPPNRGSRRRLRSATHQAAGRGLRTSICTTTGFTGLSCSRLIRVRRRPPLRRTSR